MLNVLITGITGFSGSHLAEYCINKGYKVHGLTRGRYHQYNFINHIKDDINLIEGDLSDINSIERCIKEVYPWVIFHLGAQSSVPLSWRAPKTTVDTNALGTLNLLEVIRKLNIDPIIINIGTSEEYGMVYPDEAPIKETNPLRPLSPYGVSKVASDLFAYQYYQSYGLKIIRLRPFNIIGTRGGDEIVTTNFIKQIVNIERGLQESLSVGNLDSIREFNDVRDIVRGYDMAINKCKYGEVYNVCNGNGYTIKEMLDILIEMSSLDNIKINIDKNRLRPSDVVRLIGDSTKFRNVTGWEPEYKLEESLLTVLDYWRNK